MARELCEHLIRLLRERLHNVQSMSIMSLATLLDPRFEQLTFLSPSSYSISIHIITIHKTWKQTVALPRCHSAADAEQPRCGCRCYS
ncbi:hypothetical protein JOB18_000429 [Solea senegalensis]|uniref:Uncharacterized protein n=1 Tax=Solea senegalensis TaxID=28829 RepID=A0AAV6QCW1_SOLSE|nr:hypothetical protein JOB18_000429 [Solea senegalensis]